MSLRLYVVFSLLMAAAAAASSLFMLYLARPFAAELSGPQTRQLTVFLFTGSAVAGVPFRQPGSVFISAGTWSLVGIEVDAPLITDAAFAANLTNEGGVGGTFRLLRNVTGLWLIHECRRVWAQEGREHSFDQLVALAKDAPALITSRPPTRRLERPAHAWHRDRPGQPVPVDRR